MEAPENVTDLMGSTGDHEIPLKRLHIEAEQSQVAG
jgi:hypothetical protein